jgi:biotin carboxyl carrier protein
MNLELRYNNETFNIKLEPADNPNGSSNAYRISINDTAYNVTVSRISANCLSLFFDKHNVQVYIARADGRIYVFVDGHIVVLDKAIDDQKAFSKDILEFGSKDQVTTPMPGKVVKILVKEGERIRPKQSLVIVESMKMENEIKSPADGVVKSIHFRPGDLVEPGQAILRIQPD